MAADGTTVVLSSAALVGTWRLRSWQSLADDGSTAEPFGPSPLGYVVYTADGRMITTISRADRPPIGGDLLRGPQAPRIEAFATFIAYSGTYRVDGDEVIHLVEMSLFPDWVGAEQRRHVELSADGRSLALSTGPLAAGGRISRHVLRWERIAADAT